MQTSLQLQTIHLCSANEYLLCFSYSKPHQVYLMTFEHYTFLSTTPPRNSIRPIHLLISRTDILDSTVRLLCLACHTIRSCVRVITHTHVPPHLHNSQTLRKYPFLRLSILSFALGGLVNTPVNHYHDGISPHHCLMAW